jgi:inosine triphosphate pyrophosphatase
MAPKELNFITGNKNKLVEVQAILSETPVKLQSQAVDLVEIQGTIEEISTDKARRAAEAVCAINRRCRLHISQSGVIFQYGDLEC